LTISALIIILSPGTKHLLFRFTVAVTEPDVQKQHSIIASFFVIHGTCQYRNINSTSCNISSRYNYKNNMFRFWLTWATRFLNVLANCLKYSLYSSGSVSWFKDSIQSSATRLFQLRTTPTRSHSSLFFVFVFSPGVFTSWGY